MTSNTPIKHLLGIKGLSASHIQTIFETADNFKELLNGPVKKTPALRDITIANLFLKILREQGFRLNWQKNVWALISLTFQVHHPV